VRAVPLTGTVILDKQHLFFFKNILGIGSFFNQHLKKHSNSLAISPHKAQSASSCSDA